MNIRRYGSFIDSAAVRRRRIAATVLAGTLGLLATQAPIAESAAKKRTTTRKPTIANGKACATTSATATAAGRSFTCVRLRSNALQWWSLGTIQNPIPIGRTARVSGAGSGTWDVTVLSRIDDDTERILAIDPTNRVGVPGNRITSVELRVRSLGPGAATSVRATSFEVYAAGRERIERWELGASAPEDCWNNETVTRDAEKMCMFPFEIAPAELAPLRLGVRPDFGVGAPLYFDTVASQPPVV